MRSKKLLIFSLRQGRRIDHAEFAAIELPAYPFRHVTSTIVILAGLGILALLLEMVLPGGVLGVAGGLSLVAAAVLCFVEYGFYAGLAASVAIGAFALGLTWVWMKYFHLLPGVRRMVLHGRIANGDSREASAESLTGQTGTAVTEIAPSGKASIGDQRFDAIAESTAIPKGAAISFVRPSGPGWIVRMIDPAPAE